MTLRGSEVEQRLGVTRRQLEYWRSARIVTPSARTQGGQHRYTERDLRRIRLLRTLHASGLSIRRAKKVIDPLHHEVESMLEVARSEGAAKMLSTVNGVRS